MSDSAEAARHKAKMEKRKTVQDAEVASKSAGGGLLIVRTGSGKGKSTASWAVPQRRPRESGDPC
jgi:cob(I)alamin adenosyltransferase